MCAGHEFPPVGSVYTHHYNHMPCATSEFQVLFSCYCPLCVPAMNIGGIFIAVNNVEL